MKYNTDIFGQPNIYNSLIKKPIVEDQEDQTSAEWQNNKLVNDLMTPAPSSNIDEQKSAELQNEAMVSSMMPKLPNTPIQPDTIPEQNEPALFNKIAESISKPKNLNKLNNKPLQNKTPELDIMAKLKADNDKYEKAQEAAGNSRLLAQLNDVFQRFNKEMLGKKYDPTVTERFMELANKPVEDLENRQANEMKQMQRHSQMSALANKIRLDNAMKDPNSPLSQLAIKTAKSIGLDVKDYQTLADSGLTLNDLMKIKQDRWELEKKLETIKLSSDEKENKAKQKFVKDLRKETTSGVHGKQYANILQSERMANAFNEFSKNPTGYSDFATLLGGLKVLQGDDSVVRSAEINEGKKATSLINSVRNYLDSKFDGKTLQPQQRKDIQEAVRILGRASKFSYLSSIEPILQQAKDMGIETRLLIPSNISDKDIQDYEDHKKIPVIDPNGKRGFIFKKDLKSAQKQGFTILE